MIELLKKAIELRKPIEFEYIKEGEIPGKRIGNPHILFIYLSTRNTMIHIFQTGGVSKSGLRNGLPWRMFHIDFIKNVLILDGNPTFEIEKTYNPNWVIYDQILAKV